MDRPSQLSEMHVCITGGAGFIGSNIAEELISIGAKVTVLDNLLTGHMKNIDHLLHHPSFTFIEGDIRDFETCKKAVFGCTHLSHQAALGSVPRSIDDPITSLDINILGTVNLFRAAVEEGITRIVYASSSSVYGDDQTLPKIESNLGRVLSPYAASKRSMELIQQAFVECYDVEIIGFRYFNVFGRRQDPNGPYAAVIPKFISILSQEKAPTIYGDGFQSRDFTHVSNVVNGNILALSQTKLDSLNGEVVNLAFGGTITVNDLYYGIREALVQYHPNVESIEPIYQDKRLGDILHSHADITIVKTKLGFGPDVDVKEGLLQTVKWYKEN